MKRLLLPLLLSVFSLPVYGYQYEPDLEAPDVTIYAELLGVRTDFSNFDGGNESGFRARLGLQFNDATLGNWRWRLEGGLNQFGESDRQIDFVQTGGLPPGTVSRTTTYSESMRLTGFEFGARLYDGRFFYLRGGAFVYNQKIETDYLITDRDAGGNVVDTPFTLTPDSEGNTGVSPYVGAGIEIPLFDKSFGIIAEYNYYRVEETALDNISVGAQFRF